MDGETFYQEFKEVLVYLNIPWGKKELVDVEIRGDFIHFSTVEKSVKIKVGG